MSQEHGFGAGLFIGATLGAMGALLLAPKSGRELRHELAEEGERLKTRAGEAATEIRHRGERALKQTKQTAQQTATGVKKAGRMLRNGDGVAESVPPAR